MKNKHRNREAFAEFSYWQSYSDMMAALLLIFILIIAITLAIYRQKTTDLDLTRQDLNAAQSELDAAKADLENSRQEIEASMAQLQAANAQTIMTQEELEAAYAQIDSANAELALTKSELENIVKIRTDIIGDLQSRFNNSSMKVDAQTGSIAFSSDLLFRYNSATLTGDSRETLKEVIPMYLDVLLQDEYREYIAEIIIEGHTDTDGTYNVNMDLSYSRANAVARFCMDEDNGLSGDKISQLKELLTVNGRSYTDPVYQADSGEIDMEASRRVEIKFRLKEDEMIEKISSILEQR